MIYIIASLKTSRLASPAMLVTAALAAFVLTPARAQMSLADYTATVSAITDSVIARAAGSGGGDRPATFFDLNNDAGAPVDGDAVIAGARRLYEIYRAVGGQRIDKHAYFERKDGRIYIGLDGEGGRWVDSGVQALEVFREQMVEGAVNQPTAPDGQAPCQGFICLVSANDNVDVPLAGFAPRGATQVLTLSGGGYSNSGGPPVVLAPASLYVNDVVFDSAKQIKVTLSVDEGAALGAQMLHIFNQGRAFRSAGRYLVHIVASVEELEAIAAGAKSPKTVSPAAAIALYLGGVGSDDDHGDDATSAADIFDNLTGRLEQPGDRDVFRLVVPQNTVVEVASTGGADLMAELRDTADKVIADDDDSGDRYNFRLSHNLAAGTYYITISHCCGGTGAYRLTTTLTPQ